MICRRYTVSGRVQGVFFRDSTRRQAQSLGLSGWVRNCRDGRVEALICGHSEQLAVMEKWLQTGPELAKVTNIESREQDPARLAGEEQVSEGLFSVLSTY